MLDNITYGRSPEELHFQHPYLIMGQIHSALAYYWDHILAFNQDIEQRLQSIDQMQETTKPTSLAGRFKAKGCS